MKVLEIIGHTNTADRVDRPDKNRMDRNPHGMYSYVKNDKDDPHMVRKFNKNADTTAVDGFVVYAELLHENELWSESVHLPRIYKTNTSDSGDGPVKDWTMEKLLPLKRLEKGEFIQLFERYLEGKKADALVQFKDTYKCAEQMGNVFEKYVEGANIDPDIKIRKSEPQLIKALDILSNMAEENDFIVDIHMDNFMFRRGPGGVQVVFSDPFSSVRADWRSKRRNNT